MNKKVSKTLAAVLSAAMAASAFAVSTGAAFAADNQISATVSAGSIGIVSRSAGNTAAQSGVNLQDVVDDMNNSGNVTFTVNGVKCSGTIELTSGNWEPVNNDGAFVQIDSNGLLTATPYAAQGSAAIRHVTLQHRGKITSDSIGTFNTSTTPLTADVIVEVEVVIYPEDYYVVLPDTNDANNAAADYVGYADGSTPSNDITLSMNEGVDLSTYRVRDNDNDGMAEFWEVTDYSTGTIGSSVSMTGDKSYVAKVPNTNQDSSVIKLEDATKGVVAAQPNRAAQQAPQTGTATVYPSEVAINNDDTDHSWRYLTAVDSSKVIPATVTVDGTYKVFNNATATFTSEGSTTMSADGYDVEGRDVIVDPTGSYDPDKDVLTGSVKVQHDAVLGDITSYAGSEIEVHGTTGNISAPAGTVTVDDAGTLNHPQAGKAISTGDISANQINVTGTSSRNSVTDQYQAVEVGNLEGTDINVTAYDNNDGDHPQGYGRVVVKNITIKRDAQAQNAGLTLTAGQYVNTTTVGTISGEAGPYEDSPFGAAVTVAQGTFNLGDLDKVGKVVVGTNQTKTADVTVGTIDTGTVGSNSYVDQTVNESSIQVNAGSKLAATKITTDQILVPQGTGSSSLTVPVNSLMIEDSQYKQNKAVNMYLYVTGAKSGDILYTGYNNAGTNFIFNETNSKVIGQAIDNHAYNYVMQTAAFDGIRMTTPDVSVGETPVTLSLAAMPDSTTLPEGVTVSWTATTDTAGKQTVSLTPSADGMSCVVTATGYTENNINNGNYVTVTATLMKDGQPYTGASASTAIAHVTLTDVQADKPLTGIALSETSMTMQPEETQQLTVTYTPADTNSDKTVTWSTSDEAVATVDAEGNVTAVADGTATITATCGEFTATCEVTVSENPFTVVVTNAEGEKTTCALDGSTVIEVPQSMAFNFDISSEEEIADFDYTVGNCKVGGTNTNTVWNGTSGSYQIYAAGAVGSETGAYINGIKIFTLRVTDRPFTSDTTLNMNISRGQTYQFAITPNDPDASFTFLTANGEALSTSYNKAVYPDATGTYYCKVTANAVNQDVGVYCVIDGKTYKVFTAHLVG